ncbi:MAG: ISNCY family transposase [Pyrinomonadaceae bacterium]
MEIRMSVKEAKRLEIVLQVESRTISSAEGARRLGVTVRQLRRIRKRYGSEGIAGLVSKHKGLSAKNRITDDVRMAVRILMSERYQGFGPTLAQEKLEERHEIKLSVESVRQLMMTNGHWKAKLGKNVVLHPMRQRRARYGELIQIDGSPHHWFGEEEPACTLLVFVDDATGNLMQLVFVPTESTLSYMQAMCGYIEAHGMPMTLYSDKHSVFRVNAKDVESETQFGRAVSELGIELICANSPQAKGRVERANQTLQDRLVKELRLQGITTLEQGNATLPVFMGEYNRRFGRVPREMDDGHVIYTDGLEKLKEILSIQEDRRLSKNLTCSVDGRLLQVTVSGSGRGMRGAKVKIHWHFDGRLEVRRQSKLMPYTVVERAPKAGAVVSSKNLNAKIDDIRRQRTGHKPAAGHPWARWQGQIPPPQAVAAGRDALLQAAG